MDFVFLSIICGKSNQKKYYRNIKKDYKTNYKLFIQI